MAVLRACWGIVVTLGMAALGAGGAHAEEGRDWRVGIDLGLPSIGNIALLGGGLGGLAGLGSLSESRLGIEYRVAPGWWLTADLDGHYSTTEGGGRTSRTTALGGAIGARAVIVTVSPVTVSLTLRVGASRVGYHSEGEDDQGEPTVSDSAVTSLSARVGLVVELALSDALDVRISSDVAHVGYGSFEDGESVTLGLDLRPSLGLGIHF